jgi:hypothetical protein
VNNFGMSLRVVPWDVLSDTHKLAFISNKESDLRRAIQTKIS